MSKETYNMSKETYVYICRSFIGHMYISGCMCIHLYVCVYICMYVYTSVRMCIHLYVWSVLMGLFEHIISLF